MDARAEPLVQRYHQIVLWPVQLTRLGRDATRHEHWQLLTQAADGHPWRELEDEFTGDPEQFQERHYSEFVTFLPHVRRFLYGDGKGLARRRASRRSACSDEAT